MSAPHLEMLVAAAQAVCDDADYDEDQDVCLVSVPPLERLQNVLDHIRIFAVLEGRSDG